MKDERFMSRLRALEIVPAKLDEIDAVLGILDDAASWLMERGYPTIWRPGEFSRSAFEDQISRGEVYVALIDGKHVGTFILQWSDPFFWGERPPEAGYVHKFAVRPEFSGGGVGHEMLRWAEATTRAAGKRFLRLNCLAVDRKIRDYYEKAGFIHKGDVVKPKGAASLYEKPLEEAMSL